MTIQEFNEILLKPESDILDFKREQYDFLNKSNEINTAKFVKDIISLHCFRCRRKNKKTTIQMSVERLTTLAFSVYSNRGAYTEEQKKHLVEMMHADEDLGLYDS